MTPRRPCWTTAAIRAGLLVGGLLAPTALAHDFRITDTSVVFQPDGTVRIDMTCALDELALGEAPGRPAAEVVAGLRALPAEEFDRRVANLRRLFQTRVRVRFDGQPAEFDVSFPEFRGVGSEHSEAPALLGVTARLSAAIPPGADSFTFWASKSFPPVRLAIYRGEAARPALGAPMDGALADAPPQSAPSGALFFEVLPSGQESSPFRLRGPSAAPSILAVVWQYILLGFEHILPKGLDHILFVVGLFLLSARLRPLLWQVTAFTLAHTATLALSVYGLVRVSPAIVEPLIALSIAYVAIENLFTQKLQPWRPLVVFGFGLLHGLGFAGVLMELGAPVGGFVPALLGFNAGVELGQLAVIALAVLTVGWLRNRDYYRAAVVVPASALVAAVGLYWAAERTFFA